MNINYKNNNYNNDINNIFNSNNNSNNTNNNQKNSKTKKNILFCILCFSSFMPPYIGVPFLLYYLCYICCKKNTNENNLPN